MILVLFGPFEPFVAFVAFEVLDVFDVFDVLDTFAGDVGIDEDEDEDEDEDADFNTLPFDDDFSPFPCLEPFDLDFPFVEESSPSFDRFFNPPFSSYHLL